jgi:hypothetical protein
MAVILLEIGWRAQRPRGVEDKAGQAPNKEPNKEKEMRYRRWPSVLSRLALALVALVLFSQPNAAAQANYAYRGALSSNFRMELTLSGTPASGTVTGVIRSGSNRAATVLGTYSGGTLKGNATYGGTASGTAFIQPISGALSGGGSTPGTLSLVPFPLVFNGQTSTLTFTLFPATSPRPPTPPTPPSAPTLPQIQNFHSNVGFGYTRVDLTMRFQLTGAVYQVSGQAVVHSLRPRDQTTVLQISGAYRPYTGPTAFAITGTNDPRDHPRFTGSIGGNGFFGGQMTGIPSLGITSLFFSARPQ